MSNPVLNDKSFRHAANQPGWAAPDPSTMRSTPIDDQVSPWQSNADTMTVTGTVTATGVLMVLLLGAAVVGWNLVEVGSGFPPAAMIGVVVGFVCIIVLYFKPMWAKVLAPIYALAEGVFVGAISKAYNEVYGGGIVVQAVGATLAVALTMLVLYRTRIIKVTEKLRSVVMAATMGLMLFYGITFIVSLFGPDLGAFHREANAIGILFSVFAAGLAAFNLLLDFDFIERGAKQRLPKGMEWVAAVGLLVTLVWLYLELLRLLAKLQDR
ncbi:MAG TPA: hypothetical protein DCR14_13300 [Acidimicrobiaceae bacterium]|nr:hypothetical protein [Acidimicrobiaceae bacterium]